MTTKKFTLGEFIDAIEKNGLEQAFGGLFVSEGNFLQVDDDIARDFIHDRVIESACALGQGYINIGVWPFMADDEEGGYWDILPHDFTQFIVQANDRHHESLPQIAGQLRYQFGHRLNETFEGVEVNYNISND